MADTNASLSAMAKKLKEGETVSRSHRIPFDDPRAVAKAGKSLAAMRNSMNQISSRAREATQRSYRVESGQFVTHDGAALMLTCTLTCLEDEGEDDI